MMNRHPRHRLLLVLALSLGTAMPAMGHADDSDGPAETTGEKIDETVQDLREGAKKGIDKARETMKKTGKAIGDKAKEAADAVDGESDGSD